MAKRKRFYYNNAVIFASSGVATGDHFNSGTSGINLLRQIHKSQNVSTDITINRQDVNQLGELAGKRKIIDPATVGFNFSYYLTDGSNEEKIGFKIDPSQNSISDIIKDISAEKNYFVLQVGEGEDAIQTGEYTTLDRNKHIVAALGNGFINSWALEASVGGIPTVSVGGDALNVAFYTGSENLDSPAINPANGSPIAGKPFTIPTARTGEAGMVDCLRPGDIVLDLGGNLPFGGPEVSTLNVQSVSVNVPLDREDLNKLGSNYPFSKLPTFPITATIDVTADITDFTTGNLSNLFCNSESRDISIEFKKPCNGPTSFLIQGKGVELDSQNVSLDIGSNESADISFSVQIGGPQDNVKGIFFSGS